MNDKAQEIVDQILADKDLVTDFNKVGVGEAPSNIALCKYWGKRCSSLNLPVTSSLSISLADKGAITKIKLAPTDTACDQIILNGKNCEPESEFYNKLKNFLDLFRAGPDVKFIVDTKTNIPVAAGLASSACGFAAVVLALDDLFDWGLTEKQLSILARLGSGSASRSIYHGFVLWEKGKNSDGSDSFAQRLDYTWPELRIGLLIVDNNKKKVSSRIAMQSSIETSPFYCKWADIVANDLEKIERAIANHDFKLLGQTAEQNALAMHSLMQTSIPPVMFATAQTIELMKKVWQLRENGIELYFTQDAGPNLKLLFQDKDLDTVLKHFEGVEVVAPFLKEEVLYARKG